MFFCVVVTSQQPVETVINLQYTRSFEFLLDASGQQRTVHLNYFKVQKDLIVGKCLQPVA